MRRRDNPFEEIERMLDRMNRQLGTEFGELSGRSVAVDVEDRGDEFVVTADLPGFEGDDVDVELRDGSLSIAADRTEESESERGEYVRRERRSESVSRTVSLPDPVDEESVSATHANGVLTVTLPKRGGDGSGHRIDIE